MTSRPSFSRIAATGWLTAASASTFLLTLPMDTLPLLPAILAWGAVWASWKDMGRSAKQQSSVLFLCGSLLVGWALFAGTPMDWEALVGHNMPLLTMFVAVSFLALTNPNEPDNNLPTGRKGVLSTMLTCHLLGSVINLSIIFVVADRLTRTSRLTRAQLQATMRSFTAAAFWSPFFVAIGVALTYAPGSEWLRTMPPGMLLTLPMFALTYRDAMKNSDGNFRGYPLSRDSLIIPICLALAVLTAHQLLPQLSILTLISILAPIGAWLFMNGRPRQRHCIEFINKRLANISSQFAMFLTAGVFSTGIAMLIAAYPDFLTLHFERFSPLLFMVISAIMLLIALIGVHPVVSIALISPFLTPLGADPNQLAFMFLFVWGVGTGSSPLSGIGLAMVGRYQVRSRDILALNWHYLLIMWLMAGLMNFIWFG